ncbi:MAG: hypothetical protein DWP94_03720 [Flavobacterium sp.]|nr:MAG: hypothetical protein DWP94_03720 [Flavobacterium sp.]
MDHERIFTETPKIAIWQRIDILTTHNGVIEELTRQSQLAGLGLNDELLNEKAKGITFCIRSARDLFNQSDARNLTPSIISIYYGTYNLLSALLIANVNNPLTLSDVENFSKNGGHGLKSIYRTATGNIAENEFIYCCPNGFFKEYLDRMLFDTKKIITPNYYRKIDKVPEEQIHKIVSLKELLARIPELKNIYSEIFKEQPYYLNYYASKNYKVEPASFKVSINKFQNTEYLEADLINNILSIPEEYQFEYRKKTNKDSSKEEFRCDDVLAQYITLKPKYNSPIAASCTLKPLLTIDDVFLLYFKLFYLLSIWVRYRPNLWREVYEGKYDHFRPLFSILQESAERILPNLFLNKFYKRNILFASHSYLS